MRNLGDSQKIQFFLDTETMMKSIKLFDKLSF